SDAGGFLREHGVDTSNLSSALKSLSSDREGKSKDGDVSDVVERKIRNVETGLWEFTPTGIKHVHDLLQHHGAFDPNSTHSFS
ncbi:hypothetical protein, partial [Verrucomicrobium sp. BvORR034]|uniref:hypothetical protein n=1 Tax=Verrucomicrobium sp. BvORR034 TaxID=1396418 RepID=UPI0022410421